MNNIGTEPISSLFGATTSDTRKYREKNCWEMFKELMNDNYDFICPQNVPLETLRGMRVNLSREIF